MELVIKSNITYELLNNTILSFELGQCNGTYGLDRTGQVIWDGSIIISRLLETKYYNTSKYNKIIELGSGLCCIPSLVSAYYGSVVIITDIIDELDDIRYNVNQNKQIINTNNIIIKELDWNHIDTIENDVAFHNIDMIICSDLIFGDNYNILMNTLIKLLTMNPNAIVIMSNQNRLQVHKFYRSMLKYNYKFIDIDVVDIIKEFNLSSNQIVWQISR